MKFKKGDEDLEFNVAPSFDPEVRLMLFLPLSHKRYQQSFSVACDHPPFTHFIPAENELPTSFCSTNAVNLNESPCAINKVGDNEARCIFSFKGSVYYIGNYLLFLSHHRYIKMLLVADPDSFRNYLYMA